MSQLATKGMRVRIAFIVQRYGVEVNGGAETLCRMIAERLARYHEVSVLTTRAIDYVTWQDEYPAGVCDVGGVRVLRFSVDYPRNQSEFDIASSFVFSSPHTLRDELDWMKQQGPYSSALLEYLRQEYDTYDLFVFFTYLYATTYFGLPLVKDKAVLVPTCHDEPPVYLELFDALFRQTRHLICLTAEERAFVRRRFWDCDLKADVVGMGVNEFSSPPHDAVWERIRERLAGAKFILYVGRIDEAKGCKCLVDYFLQYVHDTNRTDLGMVMVGKAVMHVPDHPQIITTGFVDETTKLNAIQSCSFMVAPSPYESLCISALEAWMLKRPVLSNGNCKVLLGQTQRTNGGLWYRNYEEFRAATTLLLERQDLADALGQRGHEFVKESCNWPRVDARYLEIISSFTGRGSSLAAQQ